MTFYITVLLHIHPLYALGLDLFSPGKFDVLVDVSIKIAVGMPYEVIRSTLYIIMYVIIARLWSCELVHRGMNSKVKGTTSVALHGHYAQIAFNYS